MKKAKGAVTVFSIIVLFSTVLLGGLFIDASRILLAKRYIRNALDSAARSSLSYYDSHLAKEYGLFGVEEKKAEEMFRKYFKTNLELSQNDGFDVLKMSVEDGDISTSLSGDITNYDVLMNSMKEYSKYRVLVNGAVGAVEKLKGLLGGGKAEVAAGAAKKGTDALEALKSEVTDLSNTARDYLSKGLKTQTDRAKNVVSNSLLSGNTGGLDLGFGEIDGQIDNASKESAKITDSKKGYQQKSAEAVNSLNGAKPTSAEYLDEETGELKTVTADDANQGDSGVRSDLPDAAQAAETEKQTVDAKIQETKNRTAQKKAEIEKKTKEAQDLNREIDRLTASKNLAETQVTTLKGHKNTLEQNRTRDRFAFLLGDDPDAKTLELQQTYEIVKMELEQLKLNHGTAEEIWDKEQEVEAAGQALKKQIEDSTGEEAKTAYDDQIKAADKDLKAAEEQVKNAKKDLEDVTKKRDALVKDIQKLYDEIPAEESKAGKLALPDSASSEDKTETAEESANFLAQMAEAVRKTAAEMGKVASDVNSQTGIEAFLPDDLLGTLLDAGLSTIESLWETIQGLGHLITGSADTDNAFLFTDYVFTTHTFLTSQTPRNNRHFQAGEVEYILVGNDAQAEVIFDTVFQIATLRLAINWADYFITGKSPEIISRALTALGRAGVQTVKDMASMIFVSDKKESASCGLCPSFQKLRLTYSDHLRLSMLLRALDAEQREAMMSRMLVLMRDTYQVQDWGSVESRRTHIKGEVTVKVDLIMLTLPMFEAVLPEDNQILHDGYFLLHDSVELGY